MDIILTLDYELFNGKQSGSVQNCLLKPTNELIKVLDRHEFKATFFVDVCFLLKLKSLSSGFLELERDWKAVYSQIKQLSDNGHDIELHMHPNWHRATYSDGVWSSNVDDYKLSDMPVNAANSFFRDGIELLSSIIEKPIRAFRAGAYCLQTYKQYPDIFRNYGIEIDSSVFRYRSAKTEKWEWYDYTKIPSEYTYRFDNDVCEKVNSGSFCEVSIPNYRVSHLSKVLTLVQRREDNELTRPWGDGKSSVGGALYSKPKKYLSKVINFMKPQYRVASIDGLAADFLKALYKEEKKRGGSYFMVMGHPKLFTPRSLNDFDIFLTDMEGKYHNKTIIQMA